MSRKKRILFLVLFQVAFLIMAVRGSHINGGEISYRYLGNNNYEIKLIVYRDCHNVFEGFDNPAYIGIYNSDKVMVKLLEIEWKSSQQLTLSIPNPCLIPPDNCVEQTEYKDTINLSAIVGGYDVVYQRCCREGFEVNLVNPGGTGMTCVCHIPEQINNSPVFNDLPPLLLCINEPININYTATDFDNDSLIYEICNPINGGSPNTPQPIPPVAPPYNNINWAQGYSESYPLDANPNFTIDKETGVLTGTPNKIGCYTFSVCVSEYRNGIFLDAIQRDYLFEVVNCKALSAATTPETFCDGLTVNFINTSENTTNYSWDFGDIVMEDTSTIENPQYTYSDTGTVIVTLIAYNPSTNCSDTSYTALNIKPLLSTQISAPSTVCVSDTSVLIKLAGIYSKDASIQWDFGVNAIPRYGNTDSTIVRFDTSGTQTIALGIRQYGCFDSLVKYIKVVEEPIARMSTAKRYCFDGKTISFDNLSKQSSQYFWDFGDINLTTDTTTQKNPSYTYNDTGVYNVTLIAKSNYCPSDTEIISFYIYPKLLINSSGEINNICLNGEGFSYVPNGVWDNVATFTWNFPNGIPNVFYGQNPINIKYLYVGYQTAELKVNQYGCEKKANYKIRVNTPPEIDFYADKLNGCVPFTVQYFDTLLSGNIIDKRFWYLDEGSLMDTIKSPAHTYYNERKNSVTLIAEDIRGCRDTVVKQEYIKVNSPPIANFEIEPLEVNIINPEFNIIDNSVGASFCTYIMSTGYEVNNCNFSWSFIDTGLIAITKIAIDETGCSDTVIKNVRCLPIGLIYIPNAFSPNGDGLNDIYKPIVSFGKSIDFKIYNRWGELIYYTNEFDMGWNGKVKNGTKLSESGIYIYKIHATFLDETERTFNGTFLLNK